MSLEFNHGGHAYRAGKLPAMKQFHIVRRLAPLLPGVAASGIKPDASAEDMAAILTPLATGLATMSDADAEYVLMTCMEAVERKQSAGGWARVVVGDRLMFEDIDMAGMLHIAWQVLQHNLSGFFAGLPRDFAGAPRT